MLRALTDAGLLRRVEIPGSPAARYERWLHDNHHHLVCRSCGGVVDVPCATGDAPCLVPTDAAGYAVDEAEVIYWGLCPACRIRREDAQLVTGRSEPHSCPTPTTRPPMPGSRPRATNTR